jgi:predicted nucleic acid-binding protein
MATEVPLGDPPEEATADALIAATAAAYQLPLITRDHDFAGIDGIDTVIV